MRAFLPGALALAGLLSACDFNLVPNPKTDMAYVVAPNRVPCGDASLQGRSCLLVKRGEDPVWREFEPSLLKGFIHELGFRYRLTVSEQFVPPTTFYELKQVLEKTPDSTIAVPGQP